MNLTLKEIEGEIVVIANYICDKTKELIEKEVKTGLAYTPVSIECVEEFIFPKMNELLGAKND